MSTEKSFAELGQLTANKERTFKACLRNKDFKGGQAIISDLEDKFGERIALGLYAYWVGQMIDQEGINFVED